MWFGCRAVRDLLTGTHGPGGLHEPAGDDDPSRCQEQGGGKDPEYRKLYGGQSWIESTFEDAKIARIDYRPFLFPEWGHIGDLLGIAVQDAIAGKRSAREALDEANQKILDLLKKAGYF